MDERRPLIQQNDTSLPWYKRKRVIVIVGVVAVLVFMVLLVLVATVATLAGVGLLSRKQCTYDNAYDCMKAEKDSTYCVWCFNSNGTAGECKVPHDDPDTGFLPLTCSMQIAVVCQAYGFATHEDKESCESFTLRGCSNPCCRWSNPTGNCYTDDPPYGPVGCCFDY